MQNAKLKKDEIIIQIYGESKVLTNLGNMYKINQYGVHPKTGKDFNPFSKAGLKVKTFCWSENHYLTAVQLEK